MSYYLYVCHTWPDDGIIKVGRSSDPLNRAYYYGPTVIIDHCYELSSLEDGMRAEGAFHRAFRPLSLKHIPNRMCEWYSAYPEEAHTCLLLLFRDLGITYTERHDLEGHCTSAKCVAWSARIKQAAESVKEAVD